MSKIRLIFLLIALSLAVSARASKPPIDCSQFDSGNCIYHWDAASYCCKASGSGCIQHCI
jgi:hypothetical protein